MRARIEKPTACCRALFRHWKKGDIDQWGDTFWLEFEKTISAMKYCPWCGKCLMASAEVKKAKSEGLAELRRLVKARKVDGATSGPWRAVE
jgi:hypothetical protein